MSPLSDWQKTKAKVLTLLAINIFQPVEFSVLKGYLSDHAKPVELRKILGDLVRERKVVREASHYRLTDTGLTSIIPGKGRFVRDIHRMEYLIHYTKQRGGSISDDGSSSII
jgi:hypothetical protein